MQHNNDISDLEYLAQLGFEKVEVRMDDIDKLNKKIRSRSISYNNGGFFAFMCILIGAFLGVSAVFAIYNKPVIFPAPKEKELQVSLGNSMKEIVAEKYLDTIEVKSENFIRKKIELKKVTSESKNVFSELPEKLEPAIISHLNERGFPKSEKELQYIPNSPVLYIHDLKVSDYHKLYFSASKYISLPANKSISAAMTERVEIAAHPPGSQPEFYLHQLLSEALLAFEKADYPRSQFLLAELEGHSLSDINALFYSGMCYYHKKNYNEAVQKFDDCLSHSNNSFFSEAQYYKALSLYENGEKGKALILLKNIVEENGFYAAKAKQILER